MSTIVVIPARMASTRLPGKPLADICGRPMIAHVVGQAMRAGIGPVVVACCELEVAEAAGAAGARAVMTDPGLPSGSDRVRAALAEVDPERRHDVVVNLQGDLPTISTDCLRATLRPLEDNTVDIATLVAPVGSEEEAEAESVVKCACAFAEGAGVARALYFSRRAIPWGSSALWHHIGVYAYRRAALDRFVRLPPSALEQAEKLEQLRALEAGMTIGVAAVDEAPFGVDTPLDLDRARLVLARAACGAS